MSERETDARYRKIAMDVCKDGYTPEGSDDVLKFSERRFYWEGKSGKIYSRRKQPELFKRYGIDKTMLFNVSIKVCKQMYKRNPEHKNNTRKKEEVEWMRKKLNSILEGSYLRTEEINLHEVLDFIKTEDPKLYGMYINPSMRALSSDISFFKKGAKV